MHYSPSLNHLLLIENGELKCFEEALQVETKEEDHAMDAEMDSLSLNQT